MRKRFSRRLYAALLAASVLVSQSGYTSYAEDVEQAAAEETVVTAEATSESDEGGEVSQ